MPDRLSALDSSLLYMEESDTPMHAGAVAVFERSDERLSYQRLLDLVRQRLGYLPRYRQRVMPVPAHLARPLWVDDVDFDLHYHVRRSALPEPGTDAALFELVARLMSRRLDPGRPLWEVYLVEGLAGGRVALVTKTHPAVVDGMGTIDIGQLILDSGWQEREIAEDTWVPRRQPSKSHVLLDAVGEAVQRPGELVENVRSAARDATATAEKAADVVGGLASALRTVLRPAPAGPLNAPVSGGRVFAVVRTKLEDYGHVRAQHGGTVNDVVLAAITGGLRQWLMSRGASLGPTASVRALVPLAVRDADTGEYASAGLIGNQVEPYLVDLPVGEPNPVLRLQHIAHEMTEHAGSGGPVAARALLRASGFAPATLHALGARSAGAFSGRIFNLVITNSPGPHRPLYADDAKLAEMFPVMPLMRNQALAIGVTSYHGSLYFGLNGDRKAMSDVDVLAGMVEDSLDELKGANG